MLTHQPSFVARHMLCAGSTDPLWWAIGDPHAHNREASRQATLCSSTPTDLPPLCLFEHGMSGPGFDVGHMPNPRSSTPRHREDHLHVCGIDLLMTGDADGPAQSSSAERLPEGR